MSLIVTCKKTLGFGDITPATHTAKLATIYEAVIGQMFVAILIAALVGKMHRSGKINSA